MNVHRSLDYYTTTQGFFSQKYPLIVMISNHGMTHGNVKVWKYTGNNSFKGALNYIYNISYI